MSYKVKIENTEHEINSSYPNIAYSTKLIDAVKFNPSTQYENTFQGMPNDTNYVTTANTLLNNKWGKVPVISKDKYSNNGSELLFADKRSCPIPYRPSSSNTNVTTWGNLRYTSGTVSFALLNGKMKVSSGGGNNFTTISDFPHGYNSLLFLDVVGGGGAGGGSSNTYWHGPCGGGGGGGGAFCTCVINMSVIDHISITIGSGGTVQDGDIATPGADTTIKIFKNNTTKTLICGGGAGGARASDSGEGGTPGDGGKFTSDFDLSDELS